MNYQLLIDNQFLDLPPTFSIAINRSIADIREPENRQSDWTKTFTLPGSKLNKQVFGQLYHINYDVTASTQFAPDFNPNLRAAAELWVDTIPQIRGYLRLIAINVVDSQDIEFECTLHGVTADLFSQIGESKLSELDFSEYNHPLSYATVSASWDTSIVIDGITEPFELGRGYVYGFIDENQYTDYSIVLLNSFKPFLYAKTVVDKILSNNGFSYTADSFFNSDTFKRLVVPCPIGAPVSSGREFIAVISSTKAVTVGGNITFDSETDPANQFTTVTGALQPVGFGGAKYNLYSDFQVDIAGLTASSVYYVSGQLLRNGAIVATQPISFATNVGGAYTGELKFNFENQNIFLGSQYTIQYSAVTTTLGVAVTPSAFNITSGTYYNQVVQSYGVGSQVDFTTFFPGDFKQSDFLKSFITMFNLYMETDPDDPTKIRIETYNDFYDGTVRDWSNKLDYSQNLTITPMGELNANPYKFSYQEGEDSQNVEYKKKYNRVYGDLTATIENDFIRNEKKIEVVFSPTLCRTHGDKTFAVADKWGKLRLLYFAGLGTVSSYTIWDDMPTGFSGLPTLNNTTSYPKVLHIDSPTSPTIDIMFGTPIEVGIPGNTTYTDNNIYNAYWSKYIAEISSVNSKIVTGFFDITPADFEKLTFRDIYFFENSYFRLNLIEDYTPETLTKCEFLQINEAAAFVVVELVSFLLTFANYLTYSFLLLPLIHFHFRTLFVFFSLRHPNLMKCILIFLIAYNPTKVLKA